MPRRTYKTQAEVDAHRQGAYDMAKCLADEAERSGSILLRWFAVPLLREAQRVAQERIDNANQR